MLNAHAATLGAAWVPEPTPFYRRRLMGAKMPTDIIVLEIGLNCVRSKRWKDEEWGRDVERADGEKA